MYQEERCIAIVTYLQNHKRITVEEICTLYGVSRDTARRDLVKLEEEGRIVRTHGGAILPTLQVEIPSYSNRLLASAEEKQRIGAAAAQLIRSGEYVLMDASTTVQCAADRIQAANVSIVTNSIDIAGRLSERNVDVYMLGGKLNAAQRFVYGAKTIENLSDYKVNKLMIGACAVHEDGLTTPYEEEGYLIREMIRRADQVILLADHGKFGKSTFYRIAGLEALDIVVTDQPLSVEWQEKLESHGIEIIAASAE